MEDVHKVYSMGPTQVCALQGVDLRIARGGFLAVMGRSGSGKSTLMNLIGCLDRPSRGSYYLDGVDVSGLDDEARSDLRLMKLGFIFQSFNLIQQLTVRENIELPLYYQGWSTDLSADRARRLADDVGLADRLEHRPSELSGGECQRVAIARSLANDPPVLLADEPTGNLDSDTSKMILDLLQTLNRNGRTIVLVTHEEEIASYAGRRVYLRDGKVDRQEEGG